MYITHACECVLQVILPETLKGRVWHTSVVIHSSPKIRIICFGGIDTWPEHGDPVPIAQTTMVELCKYTNNIIILYIIVKALSKLNSLTRTAS